MNKVLLFLGRILSGDQICLIRFRISKFRFPACIGIYVALFGATATYASTYTSIYRGNPNHSIPVDLGSSHSLSVTALADPEHEIVEESEGNNSRTESEAWTASAIHDTDGDGMIDADEVIAGSEPDNSNSMWECSLVLTNGGFRLSWPSISGRTYTVMRTTNLTNDFTAISPPLSGLPPGNWFESVNMPSNAFYRVEVKK